MARYYNQIFILFVFAMAGLAVYAPALSGQVIWDDRFLVGENPLFRSPQLAWEAFNHPLYPFSAAAYYRPMQNFSYACEYYFLGGSHRGYHITNVLLHAAAAFLLCRLLIRLLPRLASHISDGNRLWIAIVTSGCWLLHPIHHAAVGYVAGRADSLSAIFALGAWLLYEKGCAVTGFGRSWRYLVAALLMLAAFYSKEIAAVWLALFASILWYGPHGASTSRQRTLTMLSIIGIVAIYALHRTAVFADLPKPPIEIRPFTDRLLLGVQALGDYFRIVVWPVDLHMERRITPWSPSASGLPASPVWFHSLTFLGLAVLAASMWLTLHSSPWQKVRRWGLVWFLVGFLPISNLFPLNAEVAEHWIYMPSIGLLLVFATLVPEQWENRPAILSAAVAILFIALGLRTWDQSKLWISEEGFFRKTIAAGGDSARMSSNLASLLARRDDLSGAEAELRRGLGRFPVSGMLRLQLADNLFAQKRFEEAKTTLAEVKSVPQAPWEPMLVRTVGLLGEGDFGAAMEVITEADRQWPGRWDVTRLRADILERMGRRGDALVALAKYVAAHWWHAAARAKFARFLAADLRFEPAVEQFQIVSELDPRDPKPWSHIASIRRQQNRIFDAYAAQQLAVRRAPNSSEELQKLLELRALLERTVPGAQRSGL